MSGGHACGERLLLPEALSGQLEPAEEKRVMAHVQTCAACQDAAADIEVSLIALAVLKDERDRPVLIDHPDEAGAGRPHLVGDAELATALGFGAGDDVRGDDPPWLAQPDPAEPLTRPLTVVGGDTPGTRPRSAWAVRGLAAAAAVVLLAGGAVIGRQVLPPRDTEHYGPPIALAPPAAAADQVARGSVAVAPDGAALVVKLNATGLPDTGWYECVWVAGGQTRSAGSFRASGGVVKDVELRVAQPQDSQAWDLQVVAHQGQSSHVVLEGRRT